MKQQGFNLARAATTAQERIGLGRIIDGLCSDKSNGPKYVFKGTSIHAAQPMIYITTNNYDTQDLPFQNTKLMFG